MSGNLIIWQLHIIMQTILIFIVSGFPNFPCFWWRDWIRVHLSSNGQDICRLWKEVKTRIRYLSSATGLRKECIIYYHDLIVRKLSLKFLGRIFLEDHGSEQILFNL